MNKNLTPAATVLVLRDSKEGIEVLMVKRSKKSPFGNLYVFPGGKIDEDDLQKEWKSYCDGYNDSIASEILGLNESGLSYWIACIRESFETGGCMGLSGCCESVAVRGVGVASGYRPPGRTS